MNAKNEGQRQYDEYSPRQMADPEFRRVYEEEAAKKELSLQLVEARQAAGLTQVELARRLGVSQGQVARIEKRGYDTYTLTTLRRYVEALGAGFELQVMVRRAVPRQMSQATVGGEAGKARNALLWLPFERFFLATARKTTILLDTRSLAAYHISGVFPCQGNLPPCCP